MAGIVVMKIANLPIERAKNSNFLIFIVSM